MRRTIIAVALLSISALAFGAGEPTGIYKTPGGAKLVVPTGQEIEIQSGATLDLQSGSTVTIAGDVTQSGSTTYTGDLTLDDETGASPSLILTDGSDESLTITKTDGTHATLTIAATDAIQILTGNLSVGNGTPSTAQDGEDAYVEGTFEVDGVTNLDGSIDADVTTFAVTGSAGDLTEVVIVNSAGGGVNIDSGTAGIDIDLDAAGPLMVDGDMLNVGNAGVDGDLADGDNDLLVAGDLEVDTVVRFDGSGTLGDAVADVYNVYGQMRSYDGSDNWTDIADVTTLPRENLWHVSANVVDFSTDASFQALFANTQVTDATIAGVTFYGIEGKATLKTSVATAATTGIGVFGKVTAKTTATLPEAYPIYSRLDVDGSGDEITLGVNFMADADNAGTLTTSKILSTEAKTWTTGIDLSPATITNDIILSNGGIIHNTDASNIAITEANINAVGRLTTTDGVTSGTARVVGGLAYSQTVASTAVSATTTETDFDKTYTIPADTLKAGSTVRIRTHGLVTAQNSTDTLTVKVYFGSTAVITTASVDSEVNDVWLADLTITVRTAGAGGTWVSMQQYQDPDAPSTTPVWTSTVSTAVNTTIANDIKASATWSTTNAGNSCRQEILIVDII